jgi:hypothetical protein
MEWIHLSQNGIKRLVFVNTVNNLFVLQEGKSWPAV